MSGVRFKGALTQKEFNELQRLSTPWYWRHFWLLFLLLILVSHPSRPVGESLYKEFIAALPLTLLLLFALVGPKVAVWQHWRKNDLIKGPISGAADEDGVAWKTSFVDGHYPWGTFIKRRSSQRMVLLYTAPNSALYFPRSFFESDADWDAFKQLAAKVSQR